MIMCLYFKKIGDTSITFTINAVFPRYLFFIFFKVTNNNFIVFNKICHVYPTVQQLWSNAPQLVKISIIINCLLFYPKLSIHPAFKLMRQILYFYFIVSVCLRLVPYASKQLSFLLIFLQK